jgi:peptidoglycan/LPS O-acetylase OafA/YrhL
MFPLPHPSSFQWMVLYFLGCACYLRRDKILLSVPIALAVFFLAIMLFRLAPQVGRAMFPAALCYLIAAIGFHPAAYFESYRKVGDYSYGLYIYAWPIQQTIVWHFHSQQPLQLFAASYPLALMVAIASWHFIEDPSLQLKNRKRPIQGWITRTL